MANKKSLLSASSAAVDPTLDALFASSSGPVKAPSKSRYVDPPKPQDSPEASDDEDMEEDGEGDDLGSGEDDGSEASGNDEEDDDESPSTDNESEEAGGHAEATDDEDEEQAAAILEAVVDHSIAGDGGDRKRKRKKREEDGDDLESKYLQKLGDDGEPTGKRRKAEDGEPAQNDASAMEDHEMSGDDNTVPKHESLATSAPDNDVEKASRTVYLSNVSTEAIKSSKAKKILLTHLDSILDKEASPPQTIESIRFRSIPFATAGIPKRAAFIKKEVMDATTKAANAYVVFSDAAGCRAACSKLNGTVVLDRHLRVDSIAHPAVVDHRRCVFVGNLGFVDDESVLNTTLDEDGKEITEKRKRTKTPMDVEEGLWRVFSKDAGKVENVRVVRDPVTRVGKGFAYVQFYDGTSVEAALLLAGKRFPPMLPRELRVTRCRAPQKTARALGAKKQRTVITSRAKKNTDYVPKPTSESQTFAGRANKLLGRSAAFQAKGKQGKDRKVSRSRSESNGTGGRGGDADGHAIKTPEEIVFEGRRASAKDGKPKDLKFKGSKPSGQKKGPRRSHTTQRTQKWKAKQAGRK